jgi:hypothetical protein
MASKNNESIPEYEIATVSEFVARIEQIKQKQIAKKNKSDVLFRGQPCDKSLLPKIGRVKAKGDLAEIEQLMLKDFDRASLPFREFEPKDEWDLLALAQHHGMATRLLDWTRSATAALWFAVRDAPKKKNGEKGLDNGVVWVLCAEVKDFELDVRKSKPFDNELRTLIFWPKAITRRIAAQDGIFTIHKLIDGKRFIALNKNKLYVPKLVRIIIPPDKFASIRQELNMLNANAALFFPDLDGLSSYLTWRYTKLEDEI